MTILSILNLTDNTKAAMLASPEARGHQKLSLMQSAQSVQ